MKKIETQVLNPNKYNNKYLIAGIFILIAQTIYHLIVAQTFFKP